MNACQKKRNQLQGGKLGLNSDCVIISVYMIIYADNLSIFSMTSTFKLTWVILK